MTSAFVGGLNLKRGNGASPEVFTTIEEVLTMSGLGKTNETINVTNFSSGGTREYIPGLADGQEVTIECNYLPAATVQPLMITDVNNRENTNFQLVVTDGSTTKTYSFTMAMNSWVINPATEAQNKITFVGKISGDITVA